MGRTMFSEDRLIKLEEEEVKPEFRYWPYNQSRSDSLEVGHYDRLTSFAVSWDIGKMPLSWMRLPCLNMCTTAVPDNVIVSGCRPARTDLPLQSPFDMLHHFQPLREKSRGGRPLPHHLDFFLLLFGCVPPLVAPVLDLLPTLFRRFCCAWLFWA